MKKCAACKGENLETRVVHEYEAELLGAPFEILLVDAVKETWCAACNKKLKTSIPDLEGLLHVAAQSRAITPRKLTGAEVKFLRKAVGMKSKDFAKKIEMSPENLSRVENGAKPLGPGSEKLLRFFVVMKMFDEDILSKIDTKKINEIFNLEIESSWDPDQKLSFQFRFREVDENEGAPPNKTGKYEPVADAA
jgi:DNA-binding transcriptional regulator YiaG